MRFTQLAIGERFEYQNERYSKNGPLTAVNLKSNRPRMIPRSALVQPLNSDTDTTVASPPNTPLKREKVYEAFEHYHHECTRLLAEEDRQALEEARQRFLANSGLG